jgi:hypothetical protein
LCFKNVVLKKILVSTLLVGFCLNLGGCATQAERQQAANRKWLRQRQRQIARSQKAADRELREKMKSAVPSEPQYSATVENVPAAVYEPVAYPAADSEPISAPITVSASEPTANNNDGPPQP